MTRVRLSVDVDPELRRRVKIVAASKDLSVKDWIEGAIRGALLAEPQTVSKQGEEGIGDRYDRAWLESDLSRLGEFEPYEWAEGELDEGEPVRHDPGTGAVAENTEPYAEQ